MKNDNIKKHLDDIQQELQKLRKHGKLAESSERLKLCENLKQVYGHTLASRHAKADIKTTLEPESAGRFRSPDNKRVLFPDIEILQLFWKRELKVPCFYEAGPYEKLTFDPRKLRVAILTSGGVALGLNAVIHGLVQRHETYHSGTLIYGVRSGFMGLLDRPEEIERNRLTSELTQTWIHLGGSELGISRDNRMREESSIKRAVDNLIDKGIGILYVVGGDGSMAGAHALTKEIESRKLPDPLSVIGVPKTMDNDILWCWETFGFETATNEAARFITSLYYEAKSTNRIYIIQLFGAESGFVAAFAALASGVANLVLVPEMFEPEDLRDPPEILQKSIENIFKAKGEKHGIIVVAEGVMPIGAENRDQALDIVFGWTKDIVSKLDTTGKVKVVYNQPRHLIRAVPPTPTDLILSRRLASLVVDCALAGHYDFMISQHLTEYIMVPLELMGHKEITRSGMFWMLTEESTTRRKFM